MDKHKIEKISELPIHELLKQAHLIDLLWDHDTVSLNSFAIWVEKSFHLRNGTGYAYTKDMSEELVEKFNNGDFNQGSAFFKNKVLQSKKTNRTKSGC